MQLDKYLDRLSKEYLCKDNLKLVSDDSNYFYKVFAENLLKTESVESFLVQLGLKDDIMKEFGSIEKFVLSHF
jgi:hypothetical protein